MVGRGRGSFTIPPTMPDMNTKRFLFSGLIFVAGAAVGICLRVPLLSRYQLLSGAYCNYNKASPTQNHPGMFRLDTVTGEVMEVYEIQEGSYFTRGLAPYTEQK